MCLRVRQNGCHLTNELNHGNGYLFFLVLNCIPQNTLIVRSFLERIERCLTYTNVSARWLDHFHYSGFMLIRLTLLFRYKVCFLSPSPSLFLLFFPSFVRCVFQTCPVKFIHSTARNIQFSKFMVLRSSLFLLAFHLRYNSWRL